MAKGSAVMHHISVRKRIHERNEVYPHPQIFKRIIDKTVYFIGLFAVLISIPQLWQIWHYQDASGVSVITWGSYLFIELIWIMYGFLHRIKPIIFAYFAIFVVDLFIVIGTLIYS
ncbi:MAG TPA: hypothetical protein VHA12_04020 [Candidatus Nanoarchaeia archaeon]|nr:hypothetical protein [Candidatus Nanoarchaeia archaeon]